MKGFRKHTNPISLWEEDGDLEQMRIFFKTIENHTEISEPIKQRIKQKAIEKIESEQEKDLPTNYKENMLNRLRKLWNLQSLTKSWKLGFSIVGLTLFLIIGQSIVNNSGNLLPHMGSAVSRQPQVSEGAASMSVNDEAQHNMSSSASTAGPSAKMSAIAPPASESKDPSSNALIPRKITQDVSITLEVTNLTDTLSQLSEIIQQKGGYIVESEQSGLENQSSSHLTAKVPGDKLNELKESIQSKGKVLNQRTAAKDITNQYYDSQTRLQTLEAEEKQYLAILNQAKSVDDVLKVESALGSIREQIEGLKGQLKLWNNQVDYSTINLQLVTKSNPSMDIKNPWQPISWQTTWKAAQNAFLKTISGGWNILNYLVVGLGYALPFLVLYLLGWIVYCQWKKK